MNNRIKLYVYQFHIAYISTVILAECGMLPDVKNNLASMLMAGGFVIVLGVMRFMCESTILRFLQKRFEVPLNELVCFYRICIATLLMCDISICLSNSDLSISARLVGYSVSALLLLIHGKHVLESAGGGEEKVQEPNSDKSS